MNTSALVSDSLVHIAGVSGVAARSLQGSSGLIADLGLDEVDLEVLAGCQCRLGDRLCLDHGTTRIDAEELREATVADVIAITLRRLLGREIASAELSSMIAQAQARLRGIGPGPQGTPGPAPAG